MSTVPIADYALLSDCRSAALVSRAGSIDWLCFPRFDSPAVFARLLDERAGHWSIQPVDRSEVSRRYLDNTLVLETTFRTSSGTATLVDAMVVGRNERGHALGARSPGVLVRQVTCSEGVVDLEVEYAPRPEYGLLRPLLAASGGGVVARGGADVLMLSSSAALEVERSVARARLTLRAGEQVRFALQHRSSWEPQLRAWTSATIGVRLTDTVQGWRSWSGLHQAYRGPWRDLVHHSGRVLQALTFEPTGAIVAAPTTSLPESVGGSRNWDYRYTWVRDASLTLDALWVAACPDAPEAEARAQELGYRVKVGVQPFRFVGRARGADQMLGFSKWVTDAQTDEVLGFHVLGHGGADRHARARRKDRPGQRLHLYPPDVFGRCQSSGWQLTGGKRAHRRRRPVGVGWHVGRGSAPRRCTELTD